MKQDVQRTYHNDVWDGQSVFCFGSNLSGIHGAGAAKYALHNCGAVWGCGVGEQGQSYAIPTKDEKIQTLSLECIEGYVQGLLGFARYNHSTPFFVTQIGCGLAGYKAKDIAPMFKDAPENCILPDVWKEFVESC